MKESLTTDPNQAVDRCWAAYHQAVKEDVAAGTSQSSAEYHARAAYRRAMPRLHTRDDIRAFLACLADGLLFGMLDHNQGPNSSPPPAPLPPPCPAIPAPSAAPNPSPRTLLNS